MSSTWKRWSRGGVLGLLAACLFISTTGCATIVKGTSQTVTMYVKPEDADVRYRGRPVPHGKLFRVEKTPEAPVATYHGPEGVREIELGYDPDSLVVVDCLLLLLGIIPGVVALAVDFSTGAWRELHTTQQLDIRKSTPASDS